MVPKPMLLMSKLFYTSQADLTLLSFALLCFVDVAFFLTIEGNPSTSKKITTHVIMILTLLQWSGVEPAISLKYACTSNHLGSF